MELRNIASHSSRTLTNQVLPWWIENAVDHEFGGIRTMISDEAVISGDDKFVWSQARWLWVASATCNRLAGTPALLETAERTASFLRRFGQHESGCWNFRLSREGRVLEGPSSIFSDCFAIYGLSEYYRLSRQPWAIELAIETFRSAVSRSEKSSFQAIAPYRMEPGWRAHAVYMILAETAQELSVTMSGFPEADEVADACFARILENFLQPESGLIVEYLDREFRPLPLLEGALVVPGHAIECMWFLAHLSLRRKGGEYMDALGACLLRHLEFGWDYEYGGLFLNASTTGDRSAYPNGEMKIWWPHTEALYATALLFHSTGDERFALWHERILTYSETHFELPNGEWRQRLNRDASPSSKLVALPVKDPFHLPRALLLLSTLDMQFPSGSGPGVPMGPS